MKGSRILLLFYCLLIPINGRKLAIKLGTNHHSNFFVHGYEYMKFW